MIATEPVIVYIVDDDEAVRRGFSRLIRSAGLEPRPYASAEAFLADVTDDVRACILLDITMPGMAGPRVQQSLNQMLISLPVITVSAHDDEEARTCARELGARMFLRKPVDDQALLDAINWVTSPRDGD
jgi:FixJ family two-component response regulator